MHFHHGAEMRPARLIVYQTPRNPTPRERRILTLLAEGGRACGECICHRVMRQVERVRGLLLRVAGPGRFNVCGLHFAFLPSDFFSFASLAFFSSTI